MDSRQVLLAYLVIAAVILLLVWFVDSSSLGWVFLWFLFLLVVMLVAISQGCCSCLPFLAVVAFLPVIAWLIWAWAGCDNKKKHKKDDDHHKK